MNLSPYFQSIIDQDTSAVVICSLTHEIIYMNPAAVSRYSRSGGASLIGKSLLSCHNQSSCAMIEKVLAWFQESVSHNIIYTFHNEKENKDVYMVALRDSSGVLIGYYEKHEYRNPEKDEVYHFYK